MPLPGVTIDITEALSRRGAPTETGTWFLVHTAGTGPASPLEALTPAAVTEAYGTTAPVNIVRDLVAAGLREGAPRAVLVKAPTADAAGYTAALAALDETYGPGQVSIPGDSSVAAHDALVAHAGAYPYRIALLDAAADAAAADLVTEAESYANEIGAKRSTIVAGVSTVSAPANTTRVIPGSVFLAALIARGDARVGHTNHLPIRTHDGGAGQVLSLPADSAVIAPTFTTVELGELYDAGVTILASVYGTVTVLGFPSLDRDGVYRQLNVGRLVAQVYTGLNIALGEYVGRPLDGAKKLYGQIDGALRGYLLALESADALYGIGGSSYDVEVAGVNTPADVAAGLVRASVEITPALGAERIALSVIVNNPGA